MWLDKLKRHFFSHMTVFKKQYSWMKFGLVLSAARGET